MPSFNWLHLTDIHCGISANEWIWPNVFQSFARDLAEIHNLTGPWDAIFFSGDLAQSGAELEYDKFTERMDRIYDTIKALGSLPTFLCVPGNHDLVRPKSNAAGPKQALEWSNRPEVPVEFWRKPSHPVRKVIATSFENYTSWLEDHHFPRPEFIRSGILPGDFSATITKGAIKIGVVGLNSTFMQLDGSDFQGKLTISPEQLVGVCGTQFDKWFDDHDLSLLMMHHPANWLNSLSQAALHGEIAVPGRFAVQLVGHMHEANQDIRSIGGATRTPVLQGCSLFGLEQYGSASTHDRRHGYMVGRIDLGAESGTLRVWPRVAQRHSQGHWHFVGDSRMSLETDGGIVRQPVAINQKNRLRGSEDSYRILLLSTDLDLAQTRSTVAEHLSRSLGVKVHTALGNEELASFNLVILLQGWRWDGGKAAAIWSEAGPSQRCAFVVSEDGDWPPYRLVEISADSEVRTFRNQANPTRQFSKPEELSEAVGHFVTSKLSESEGDSAAGLRDWERAYLEFRLPAWRSGRTALGQPHLFDAEQAQELYQDDLYVPLDGSARLWRLARDGRPFKLRNRRKRKVDPLRGPSRVPLEKWIAHPQIPRIALVGAPGGGKTIFLTRTAAMLAYACLGRRAGLGNDLDVERLRRGSMLPLPIVIEATRLAIRNDSSVESLLETICDEVSAAGIDRPSSEELKLGLKEGRYFLFVDALDEIADANARSGVLALIKGISGPAMYPMTRLLLTTRSARYTGKLKFGPELETVEVAPLNTNQVKDLCGRWSNHRARDEEYKASLMSAVSGLSMNVQASNDDQALTENPLMLTAICMVFERYRSLPDDRGRLCDLLIDDLCRSRRSEDTERGWKLDEAAKKDILQRIALAMQYEGAQSWPVARAIEIATQIVPESEVSPLARAKRYLDWTADHTGILRFQEQERGEERLRFWHRLFREYLSANRIAQEDTTAAAKIDRLWENNKLLLNPFWEDVIRLLPRSLGTIEKASSFKKRLEELADQNSDCRGRLYGLSAAAIIENRDLYPQISASSMAGKLAQIYMSEGLNWNLGDRLLFLDALGRLDPAQGDPRLVLPKWLSQPALYKKTVRTIPSDTSCETVELASWPTTVHEFRRFCDASDYSDDEFWNSTEYLKDLAMVSKIDLATFTAEKVSEQRRFPNRPVTDVPYLAMLAYCRWLSKLNGCIIRLPTPGEWKQWDPLNDRLAQEDDVLSTSANIVASYNLIAAGIGHTSPIGTFPAAPNGSYDMIGNVWETTLPKGANDQIEVYGCAYDFDLANQNKDRMGLVGSQPAEFFGHSSIGFRCVRVVCSPGTEP